MARQQQPRYTPEFKRKVVEAYLTEEPKPPGAEVAKRFRISTASVHAWSRDPELQPTPEIRTKPNGHAPTLVERFGALEAWCQQIGRELGIELEA